MNKGLLINLRKTLTYSILVFLAILLPFSRNIAFGNTHLIPGQLSQDYMSGYELNFISNIPIVVIRTDFDRLRDRETPPASVIWLFDNGVENRLTDTASDVLHFSTVHYRGFSSGLAPKKPLSIDIYDATLYPLQYSFFGLDATSKWVLRSPYYDKSMIRDWFGYEMAATVLDWQPRGKPVNLFLQNGASGAIEYNGVYFLCQNITGAAESWLGLNNFDLQNTDTVDLAGGGYLFQRDRIREFGYCISIDDLNYRIMHPKKNAMTPEQDYLLINEITFYTELLTKRGRFENVSFEQMEYDKYIDIDSFVDYFLVSEMVMCMDAGYMSTYMYRPVGQKLTIGPLWDNDLSMGNVDWTPSFYYVFNSYKHWFQSQLLQNKEFTNRLVLKWQEYRDSIWTDGYILGVFDEMTLYISEAAMQNAKRWPELYDGETRIFANFKPDSNRYTRSWEEEIETVRNWLVNRLQWLDENIPKLVDQTPEEINAYYLEQNSLLSGG